MTKDKEYEIAAYKLLFEDARSRLVSAVRFTGEFSPSVEQVRRHYGILGEALVEFDKCEDLYQQAKDRAK